MNTNKSLTNGTNYTAAELCQILDGCAKAQVVELVLGDLRVSFSNKPIVENIIVPETITQGVADTTPQAPKVSREDYLEQLMVEDPLAFEQEMMRPETNSS